MLKELAVASVGETSLVELLRMQPATRSATMIAVTPSTDPGWIGAVRSKRSGGRFALLVDPAEFGHPGNLNRVVSALASSGIPYQRMKRQLLTQAYQPREGGARRRTKDQQTGDRYLHQGRKAWQRMG